MEGVDADEHDVVVLEEELDHLLGMTVDVGLHKSAELGDAMVDMHDIVAGFDLLQLLETEGELAAAGTVALQVVFVETVEDLMVGEETDFRVVVHESLMDSAVDGRELDLVAPVFEDGLETLVLIGGVGEYEDAVAVVEELRERVGYQREILVVKGLEGGMELKEAVKFPGDLRPVGGGAEIYDLHRVEAVHEGFFVDKLLHGLGVSFTGHRHVVGYRLGAYPLDAAA